MAKYDPTPEQFDAMERFACSIAEQIAARCEREGWPIPGYAMQMIAKRATCRLVAIAWGTEREGMATEWAVDALRTGLAACFRDERLSEVNAEGSA